MLGLLAAAPSLLNAATGIVRAITGSDPPAEAQSSPAAMAAHIESLPPEQQMAIRARLFEHLETMDKQSTERWAARMAMEQGADVEKIRATARPQIALQAMSVIGVFRLVLIWALAALTAQWLVQVGFEIWGCSTTTGATGVALTTCRTFPATLSVTALLAQLEPVTSMIWPPLMAALAASVSVINAYMGARERDKARADEMAYGRPLDSTAATVTAAGGLIANVIGAVRRK